MTARDAFGLAAALVVAMLGTLIFEIIGFPSAPLTGSAAAVSIAALFGLPIFMPVWLRTTAFVLLGINIGSSVTREMLATALAWPVTIAILAVSLFVSMQICRFGLRRWMGFSPRDAILAAAPGHLSYVLALSLSDNGQTSRIAIVQSIRVLFLTLCVPVLVASVFGATGVELMPDHVLSLWQLALLVGVTLGVGVLFSWLKVPAAYLLAGILCSALGHIFAVTPGRPPEEATFVAFLVMGTLIGSRFVGQKMSQLRLDLLAGLWVTGTNVLITLVAIAVSMQIMGMSPALLIVAFAPGGVEAMAAIAVTLGLDPAFVAAHHVMRLMILTILMPLMLSSVKRA
ncbi:AbrB family transcriptional regulator [Tritonibacter scottomollicae]|uniref:AbrB family transcriptional regulator n=1 Tax=Tritonibacter scottomollicae TaxID=483013 RepID=A0ABZ0HBM0_TRISK|nr:AbrB family transcriptional regulator [Tritonibacter scottomollicae]WOI32183.1 AbrB family transcriptional regulator [Tritonibacter scottomollicae]